LRGLDDVARQVERALESNDEVRARSILPALVGRDPDTLDCAGLIRATVESVAENTSDGVIAPLLFLFAGGPVAAIAYKAVNTLDSPFFWAGGGANRRRRELPSCAADGGLHNCGGAIRDRSCVPCMGDLSRGRAQAFESQRRVSGGCGRRSARYPAR
jgi:hypothetical protein